MKRIAFALAAVALTGAMAFADDMMAKPGLVFGGYLDTGLKLTNTSAGNALYIGGDDSGIPLGSLELAGSVTGGMSGLNFKFRFEPTKTDKVDLENAYFYAKPVDGLKVLFGNIDGSNYGLPDDNGANPGGGWGAQLQYAMGGLGVGAQLHDDATNAVHYSAGASYAIDKVATLVANLYTNTANKVDGYGVGASVSAVPGLTLKGGYWATAASATAATTLDLTVGYAITDALSAQAVVYDYLAPTAKIKINPSVSYTVSPMLGVGAGYTYWTKVGQGDINVNATYTVDANAKVVLNADILDTANGNTASNVFKADFRYSF